MRFLTGLIVGVVLSSLGFFIFSSSQNVEPANSTENSNENIETLVNQKNEEIKKLQEDVRILQEILATKVSYEIIANAVAGNSSTKVIFVEKAYKEKWHKELYLRRVVDKLEKDFQTVPSVNIWIFDNRELTLKFLNPPEQNVVERPTNALGRFEKNTMGTYLWGIEGSQQFVLEHQFDENPVDAVKQYFDLTSRGDYKSAWNLIHPSVEKVAEITGNKAKEKFLAMDGKPGPKLVSVTEGQRLDEFKFYSTQLRLADVATVEVELDGGVKKIIHLAKNQGNWRLFWDVYHEDLD